MGLLCIGYVLLVLYGSLMPFDLTADHDTVSANFDRAWTFWPFGGTYPSLPDMAGNLLLYASLGSLLATWWRAHRRNVPAVGAVAGAWLLSVVTSIAVEGAQLLSLTRTSSIQDVLADGMGGLIGGLVGAVIGRATYLRLHRSVRQRVAARPMSLVAGLLGLCLLADALFPLRPTLDVSTVLSNIRNSCADLSVGLAAHPWHYWFVKQMGVYAVFAGVLGAASHRRDATRWLRGMAAAIVFAGAAEACKPFIDGRTANIANVIVATVGTALGALLAACVVRRLTRRAGAMLAVLLLLGYVTYLQWSPFSFAWNPAGARAKWPSGAAWLPLYHYAIRGHPLDVVLFTRSILLLAGVTFSACLGGLWADESRRGRVLRASLVAGGAGLVLELGQFLLPGRYPTTTDIFCFALGGALGAWAFVGFAASRQAERPHASTGGGSATPPSRINC